jgi:hypothetical protein
MKDNRDVAARHNDIPQDGLFDIEAPVQTKERKRYVKPVGHADCPLCPAEEVAQYLDNGVLRWKAHNRRTISGRALQCSMSDRPVES